MQMLHALPAIDTGINHQPKTGFGEVLFGGRLIGRSYKRPNDIALAGGNGTNTRNVFLRNKNQMDRSLGPDICKPESILRFIDDVRGKLFSHNPAEQAFQCLKPELAQRV